MRSKGLRETTLNLFPPDRRKYFTLTSALKARKNKAQGVSPGLGTQGDLLMVAL